MRDVGERAAVDEGGRAFERLHQVGRQRVLEQRGHRAMRLEVAGAHGFAVARIADDDVGEPLLEVLEILGEAEDRHHLGRDRDVEAVLAREAVGDAAERGDDSAQRPVVHVHDPAPGDPAGVDAELVAPVDVVVDQCGQQVVGGADGVEVAGEMEVDVLHRHDLGVAPARSPAFYAEHRAERWLAHREDCVLTQPAQRLRDADGHGRLPFPGRRGVDPGDEDELALGGASLERAHGNLRLVAAVQLELILREPELGRHIDNRPELRGLRDRDVGRDLHRRRHSDVATRAPKQRRAFSVVRSASASNDSPRRSAARWATSRVNAGSLRPPRCGTGAR